MSSNNSMVSIKALFDMNQDKEGYDSFCRSLAKIIANGYPSQCPQEVYARLKSTAPTISDILSQSRTAAVHKTEESGIEVYKKLWPEMFTDPALPEVEKAIEEELIKQ